MADVTAREQLMLELVNRARMDPAGEAQRFGISLNANLPAGTISTAPKQVLAFDPSLNEAADAHSSWMLANDVFSHTGVGSSSPGDRMEDAGYRFTGAWTWGENIAWSGSTGSLNGDLAVVQHHRNLFLSAGHRENILNGSFREIGIGSLTGQYGQYNALMTTQAFATSGSDRFVTGVVYDDTDGDDFYSVGEGRGGHTVSILQGGSVVASSASTASGGFAVSHGLSGNAEVRFSGGGLPAPAGAAVTLGGSNIKIDLVDDAVIQSNGSAKLTQQAKGLTLLGIQDINGTGNNLGNTITGNSGDNVLKGGAGADTLVGGFGDDRLAGGGGRDVLKGDAGADQFVFASLKSADGDTIRDFASGTDRINVSGIDAVAGGADQAFDFTGTGFDGAGSLRAVTSNGNTLVQGDIDGDGTADFTLTLTGLHALSGGDFIL